MYRHALKASPAPAEVFERIDEEEAISQELAETSSTTATSPASIAGQVGNTIGQGLGKQDLTMFY